VATIIESFLVTLGFDVSKFKDGSDQATKELNKLKHEVGATGDAMTSMQGKVTEMFAELVSGALLFHEAFKIKDELAEFVHHTVEADVSTGRLAKNLNITVEELGAWQNAAKATGGSAESLNGSIKGIAGSLVDIEKGLPRANRALIVFKAAGITGLGKGIHKNVLDVMDQLSGSFENRDPFEAARLGSRLGLSEDVVRLLRKGKDGVRDLKDEMAALGVASTEDVEASEQFHESQIKLDTIQESLGRKFREIVLPLMQKFLNITLKVVKFLNEHASAAKAVFLGLATGVTVLGVASVLATPQVAALAAAVVAAVSPFLATAAAIAVIVGGVTFLISKFKEWQAEGSKTDTTFGRIAAKIMAIWNSIKDYIIGPLMLWWEYFKAQLDVLMDVLDLIFEVLTGNNADVQKAWESLAKDLQNIFGVAFNYIEYMWGRLVHDMQQKMKDGFGNWLKDWAKGIPERMLNVGTGGAFGFAKGRYNTFFGDHPDTTPTPKIPAGVNPFNLWNSPMSHLAPSNSTSTHSTMNIDQVTIHTQATDGQGVMNAFRQWGAGAMQSDGGLR